MSSHKSRIVILPFWGFPGGASGKEPTCQCRRHKDVGLISGLGRYPGGGIGNPLENPMDRGAWRATVLGVIESWTQLKPAYTHACNSPSLGSF